LTSRWRFESVSPSLFFSKETRMSPIRENTLAGVLASAAFAGLVIWLAWYLSDAPRFASLGGS
jgi:hypothetical protein